MQRENRLAYKLALIATLLALCVVMLGAYTRLKEAGLSCPSWPNCYSQKMVIAADNSHPILLANEISANDLAQKKKAWTEMTHRYFAATLGALAIVISLLTLHNRRLPEQPLGHSLALIAVVVFQVLLGKWTVSMHLFPVVVMSHLLGGMAILTLLWLLALRLGDHFVDSGANLMHTFRPWAALGILILVAQIFLGGWTSSNYAALICPDFPFCQGKIIPALDFSQAFHWMSIGPNYQGGVLDNIARVTIHMMHRIGAFVTGIYLLWLAAWVGIASHATVLKKIALAMIIILLAQITLGILNVVWLLPLPSAVAHNGVAALLLLSLVTLNYALYAKPKSR